MPPIRIAILECDTPLPKTRERYGGYGNLFKELLEAGAHDINLPKDDLHFTIYDVVTKMEYPNLDDVDGILMTGSSMYATRPFPYLCPPMPPPAYA